MFYGLLGDGLATEVSVDRHVDKGSGRKEGTYLRNNSRLLSSLTAASVQVVVQSRKY